jgi:hypothetical protein
LNEHLLHGCRHDEGRRIAGKPLAVGEAIELAETSFPTVDGKGCVKVRTNWYSTPLKPGRRCQARLFPAYVEIWQERECVARRESCDLGQVSQRWSCRWTALACR